MGRLISLCRLARAVARILAWAPPPGMARYVSADLRGPGEVAVLLEAAGTYLTAEYPWADLSGDEVRAHLEGAAAVLTIHNREAAMEAEWASEAVAQAGLHFHAFVERARTAQERRTRARRSGPSGETAGVPATKGGA